MSEAPTPAQVTLLLNRATSGDRQALDGLLPLVYTELRQIARQQMAGERASHTLQPTALLNEAYLRLLGQQNIDFANHNHFFAVAANVMRRILIDHARARASQKRGGEVNIGRIDDDAEHVAAAAPKADVVDLIALDDAVTRLESLNPRAAKVVELKYFGGLTSQQAGSALGVSERTVADDWEFARAWLGRELEK